MLNYSKNKKIKLSTYKAIRENISLNKNEFCSKNYNCNYERPVFQMAELNLINHLENNIKTQSEKIIIRWWEN
jgi:hypothetical protein